MSHINNPQALELASKTKNKNILTLVVGNSYTPEKTVLQILRKSKSKSIVTAAAGRTEKSVLLYAGCVTSDPRDINRIFGRKDNMRLFTPEDVMMMLKRNPSCKFDILKRTYFKLSDEQLLSLKKLKDKDVDWIVDSILRNNNDEVSDNSVDAKINSVANRIMKASRIIARVLNHEQQE